MDRKLADLCFLKQEQLKKVDTFEKGIQNLLEYRKLLMDRFDQYHTELSDDEFAFMPYPNVKDYRSKQ